MSKRVCEEDLTAILETFAFSVVSEITTLAGGDAFLTDWICELIVAAGTHQHTLIGVGLCVVDNWIGAALLNAFEVLWVSIAS